MYEIIMANETLNFFGPDFNFGDKCYHKWNDLCAGLYKINAHILFTKYCL
jgi:hypothetical protein